MMSKGRQRLRDRVEPAAAAALAAKGFVAPIDILIGLEWLKPDDVERWRKRQIPYLERVVQANLSRISDAMKDFRTWAIHKGLKPSETVYKGRRTVNPPIRFSKSGHPTIEKLYRTHWVAPVLREKKQERVETEKAAAAVTEDVAAGSPQS